MQVFVHKTANRPGSDFPVYTYNRLLTCFKDNYLILAAL